MKDMYKRIKIQRLTYSVNRLKSALAVSDYKIIKCAEYQAAGQELPYNIAELHVARQAMRDKINALEELAAIETDASV